MIGRFRNNGASFSGGPVSSGAGPTAANVAVQPHQHDEAVGRFQRFVEATQVVRVNRRTMTPKNSPSAPMTRG